MHILDIFVFIALFPLSGPVEMYLWCLDGCTQKKGKAVKNNFHRHTSSPKKCYNIHGLLLSNLIGFSVCNVYTRLQPRSSHLLQLLFFGAARLDNAFIFRKNDREKSWQNVVYLSFCLWGYVLFLFCDPLSIKKVGHYVSQMNVLHGLAINEIQIQTFCSRCLEINDESM